MAISNSTPFLFFYKHSEMRIIISMMFNSFNGNKDVYRHYRQVYKQCETFSEGKYFLYLPGNDFSVKILYALF